MFAKRYFAPRMFAPRYFPDDGGIPPVGGDDWPMLQWHVLKKLGQLPH